jgi:flagellar assembly factor FliW
MNTDVTSKTGMMTTERQQCIELPLGLLGFEQFKEWRLLEARDELPFRWLQAASDPSLTFLIVPAFEVLPSYQPEIHDEDAAFLGLKSAQDAVIFGIVTLRPRGKATVNLKGPVILNRLTGRGKQVVLANATDYPVQHPLPCGG